MRITCINVPNNLKNYLAIVERELKQIFGRVSDKGEVIIICDFPPVTDSFDKTSLLFLINIPYERGSYYRCTDSGLYLNSLAFGINFVRDNTITDVDEEYYYTEQGAFPYKDKLKEQSEMYSMWGHEASTGYFKCAIFDWVSAPGSDKKCQTDYVVFNQNIIWYELINSACRRVHDDERLGAKPNVYSFYLKRDAVVEQDALAAYSNALIEKANEQTELGILTKKKVDSITRSTKTTDKIKALQGDRLCLVTGKAGSGKTLALVRAMCGIVGQHKHVRFLTYNNLLVMDIKQYIRAIKDINSKNAAIGTLHKFFYNLSKRLHVSLVLDEGRMNELETILNERIDMAEQIINDNPAFPVFADDNERKKFIDDLLKEYNVDDADRSEVREYLRYSFSFGKHSTERRKEYFSRKHNLLVNHLHHDIFINDYNKVLETMYLMLDNTHEFVERFDIKNRRSFLEQIMKTDIVEEQEQFTEETMKKFIAASTRNVYWSNSIIIDEAQDCQLYEKLIIMKLRGAENLIVASGGKDQLIRNSREIDWRVALGTPVPYEEIKLGRRSYRLKGNIVRFVNEFNRYYSLSGEMSIVEGMEDKGSVILDFRHSPSGDIPLDIIERLNQEGKVLVGVGETSAYERLMLLIPGVGFTQKQTGTGMLVDQTDSIKTQTISANRTLNLPDIPDVKIWDGTCESKGSIELPKQNECRCIYFESCRGLEAWSVMCLNLDIFFYLKQKSAEAEQYADAESSLFADRATLMRNYALLWCNMAFTRAIDTLYIRVKEPRNEFSQNLVQIAKQCGNSITILSDQ